MKAIATVILITLIIQGSVQAAGLAPAWPVELYFTNIISQNGPTHLLQCIPEKGGIPEDNRMEELEQKFIEIRLLQQSV